MNICHPLYTDPRYHLVPHIIIHQHGQKINMYLAKMANFVKSHARNGYFIHNINERKFFCILAGCYAFPAFPFLISAYPFFLSSA